MRVTNENGTEYEVLAFYDDLYLLKGEREYVVANHVVRYKDGRVRWSYGAYFQDEYEARKDFAEIYSYCLGDEINAAILESIYYDADDIQKLRLFLNDDLMNLKTEVTEKEVRCLFDDDDEWYDLVTVIEEALERIREGEDE